MLSCQNCFYCERKKGECPFYESNFENLSISELKKSAHKDEGAAVYLAACLLYGHRIEKNLRKAKSLLNSFEKRNYAPGKFVLSQIYFSDPLKPIVKPKTALELCEDAAQYGCNLAAIQLYHCYLNGHTVMQDYHKAGKWCEYAATRGSKELYRDYAEMCCSDKWGVYNLENACTYYERLSKSGDEQIAECIKNIAYEYAEKCVCNKDYKTACDYFEKAQTYGHTAAHDRLVELHKNHLLECFPKSKYSDFVDKYNPGKQYLELGNFCLENKYAPDAKKAISFYKSALHQVEEELEKRKLHLNSESPELRRLTKRVMENDEYFDRIDIGFSVTGRKKVLREKMKKCYSVLLSEINNIEILQVYHNATRGDATSQYELARLFCKEEFEFHDPIEAVDWLLLSANQGYVLAQVCLGHCYDDGYGVKMDYGEAVKWYRLAAEQGDAVAQKSLGDCYGFGNGVTKDYVEALKWYRLAAEQGHAYAQDNIGVCYYNGWGVAKDYTEAVKWYRLAAEQGYTIAQKNLGERYYYGEGVEKNYAEAVKWYRLSAEQGNATAQRRLGECYCLGDGVTKDYCEAVKWYRLSVEQGDEIAQYNLGVCYYNGWGVTEDMDEAIKWFALSAKQGHREAKYALEAAKSWKAQQQSNIVYNGNSKTEPDIVYSNDYDHDQASAHKEFLEKQLTRTLTPEERDDYDRKWGG